MTYDQMKLLIEFIKLCASVACRRSNEWEKVNRLEAKLLMSCANERKF